MCVIYIVSAFRNRSLFPGREARFSITRMLEIVIGEMSLRPDPRTKPLYCLISFIRSGVSANSYWSMMIFADIYLSSTTMLYAAISDDIDFSTASTFARGASFFSKVRFAFCNFCTRRYVASVLRTYFASG